MRFPILASSAYAAAALAALVVAACGSNPGFSGPGYPAGNPGSNPVGPQGAVTVPSGSPVSATPGATLSSSPAAKPAGNALSVAGATARLAYDGSASNPSTAQRILILSYSIDNPTSKSASIRRLSIAPSGDQRAPLPAQDLTTSVKPLKNASGGVFGPNGTPSPIATATSLNVPANQDSAVQVVAVTVPAALAAYKQIAVSFFGDKGPALASATLDVAPADVSLTPLDSKSPKGALSIDSIEIGAVAMAGSGQHYKVTFAVTNAGTAPAMIDQFVIKPPKGAAVSVSLPVNMLPRTTTSFITIVAPYDGKTLPSGSYQVTATKGDAPVASGTGDIL